VRLCMLIFVLAIAVAHANSEIDKALLTSLDGGAHTGVGATNLDSSCSAPPMAEAIAPVIAPAVAKPKGKHDCTLIWLHGLGDQGASWAPAFKALQNLIPSLKVICPTAPIQPVTLNGGMEMTSWHDIKNLRSIDAEDYKGLKESSEIIQGLILDEIKNGIPSNKIVLGGFSQGAGLSLYAGYQFDQTLAGICAFSGYLPYHGDYAKAIHAKNAKTRAFVGHGDSDQVVNIKAGEKAAAQLKAAGVPVEYHVYAGMGHSTTPMQMRDATKFLVDCFKNL